MLHTNQSHDRKKRKFTVRVSVCAVLGVCLLGFLLYQGRRPPVYKTPQDLFLGELGSGEAETAPLAFADPLCYAVYNSQQGSLLFLQMEQTEKGYRVLRRTEKLGFPTGGPEEPRISGSTEFDFGRIVFDLSKGSSAPALEGDDLIQFSDATLLIRGDI